MHTCRVSLVKWVERADDPGTLDKWIVILKEATRLAIDGHPVEDLLKARMRCATQGEPHVCHV